jgi:hypothetical protein
MRIQQLQGQLWKQHSADTINYITGKEKHKDNSYNAFMIMIIVVVAVMAVVKKWPEVTCILHMLIHIDAPLTTQRHALG